MSPTDVPEPAREKGASPAGDARAQWPAIEQGSGVPLVFLHGYPLNHSMWLPVLDSRLRGAHAVLLDLPGFGLAEDWPVPETQAGFAESIHRTLVTRFRSPVVLVGHSFGGYLALQLVHDHPEAVAGLVLTNTRSTADAPEAREKRLATVKRLENEHETLDVESTARGLVAPSTWAAGGPVAEAARAMVQRARPRAIRGALRAMAGRPDLTPTLSSIRVPSLVIWGEQDQLISPTESKAMLDGLPDAQGVGIPGVGHLPSLESPEPFVAALRGFLDRIQPL